MFQTNVLEDSLLMDQKILKVGQGPPAIEQPKLTRVLLGEAFNLRALVLRNASRGASARQGLQTSHPLFIKGVQVRIHGVGMNLQRLGDLHGIQAGGIEQDRFRSALDLTIGCLFQNHLDPTQLGGGGLADR